MMDRTLSTYCGLYCPNCSHRAQVGPDAIRLRESMQRIGYERIGPMIPGFPEFWSFLSELATNRGCCGCRKEGGNPYCRMRLCARDKNVEFCALCEAYPCEEFERAFSDYPMLEEDNQYLRENGLDSWLKMQDERRCEGYTYTDAKKKA